MKKGGMELTEAELDTRFRKLGIHLNGELGFASQALQFRKTHDRSGQYVWVLRGTHIDDADGQSFPGMACSLASAADSGAQLYFALTEQWVFMRQSLAFRSCNLRFLVSTTDPQSSPLQFRLEWAGPDPMDQFRFPGQGAAHPHWQFDVDEAWWRSRPDKGLLIINLEPSDAVDVVDLEADDSLPNIERSYRALNLDWFHKLHLPARAVWSDLLRDVYLDPIGQQHEPASSTELDNWILSALRYMRHEFELYSY